MRYLFSFFMVTALAGAEPRLVSPQLDKLLLLDSRVVQQATNAKLVMGRPEHLTLRRQCGAEHRHRLGGAAATPQGRPVVVRGIQRVRVPRSMQPLHGLEDRLAQLQRLLEAFQFVERAGQVALSRLVSGTNRIFQRLKIRT